MAHHSGEEASAYYAAGTAQYHINADIMYALRKYVQATGDDVFLRNFGAEMLIETARLWLDLGFYSDAKGGKFCINGVTGPDEYKTVVNNNAYTNLMARENLRYAAQVIESLRTTEPDAYDALVQKTALEASEVKEWIRAADNMYVPYDETLGHHSPGRQLSGSRALGLPEHTGGSLSPTAVLPPAEYLPEASDQAGGRSVGHVLVGRWFPHGDKEAQL